MTLLHRRRAYAEDAKNVWNEEVKKFYNKALTFEEITKLPKGFIFYDVWVFGFSVGLDKEELSETLPKKKRIITLDGNIKYVKPGEMRMLFADYWTARAFFLKVSVGEDL